MTAINIHLKPYRSGHLTDAVEKLEAAVASGMVPNKLFVDAKDTINRAIEEAAEAFLQSGPHVVGRDGQPHHQSDWWLAAYDADAFVHGAHGVPAALKRAQKNSGLQDYAAFIAGSLLPLNELLQKAKPLIKKRGELPKVRTEKQIADDADRMTCQCCARKILANTGTIAHHGYERPSHGWQTGSCVGAKHLPFEVSRDQLGIMITSWRKRHDEMKKNRTAIRAEKVALDITVEDRSKPRNAYYRYPVQHIEVTRKNFDAMRSQHRLSQTNFDTLKNEVDAHLSRQIKNIDEAIREQHARYEGWKQTHEWSQDQWKPLAI